MNETCNPPCEHGNCVKTGSAYICECPSSFGGKACNLECGRCAEDQQCAEYQDGKAYCLVSECYYGCYNGGTCGLLKDSKVVCFCADGYYGDNCEECAPGYRRFEQKCHAVDCLAENETAECSGHGECSYKLKSGKFECACGDTFAGYYCADCAAGNELRDPQRACACKSGYHDDGNGNCIVSTCFFAQGVECGGQFQGSCEFITETSQFECRCKNNFDPANNCVTCPEGFYLDLTTYSCSKNNCHTGETLCGGFGTCVMDEAYIKSCVCGDNFDYSSKCLKCQKGYTLKEAVCDYNLSTGATAGIAIAVIVLVLGLVVFGVWYIRARKQDYEFLKDDAGVKADKAISQTNNV